MQQSETFSRNILEKEEILYIQLKLFRLDIPETCFVI